MTAWQPDAADCWPAGHAAIDQCLVPAGPTAANPPQWRVAAGGADTDRQTPDSCIEPASHSIRAVTSLMNCRTYPGADCDTDHQLFVVMLKVRLGKRQRQHSILPLNLDELKEDKAVQFAAEVYGIGGCTE